MKVLIINPPPYEGYTYVRDQGCWAKSKAGYVYPQVGLAYIAAVLEAEGYQVDIIDAQALRISLPELTRRVEREKPEVAIVNTVIAAIKGDLEVARAVKGVDGGITTVMVGSYAHLFPDNLLQNPDVDFAVRGEPEFTILEFIRNLEEDGNPSNIQGLSHKNEKKVIHNPDRPFVENLDGLPYPAHHLLPLEKYFSPLAKAMPLAMMMTSRGCPFQCTYCNRSWYGTRWRARSAENVVGEVEYVAKKLHVREIRFRDDTFTVSRKRVEDICRGMMERGVKVHWKCEGRVDTVTPRMLKTMQEAGCHLIFLGVESGCQEVLDATKKGFTLEQVRKAFRWAREAGLDTLAHVMMGVPGETAWHIRKTIDFVKELSPDYVSFNLYAPIPGTEMYEVAKRTGRLIEEWSNYDLMSVAYESPDLPAKELYSLWKQAYREFYLRPRYVAKRLRKIGSFRELWNASLGARSLFSWVFGR